MMQNELETSATGKLSMIEKFEWIIVLLEKRTPRHQDNTWAVKLGEGQEVEIGEDPGRDLVIADIVEADLALGIDTVVAVIEAEIEAETGDAADLDPDPEAVARSSFTRRHFGTTDPVHILRQKKPLKKLFTKILETKI